LENSKDVLRGTTCEKNIVRHQFALARPALTPALRSRIRPSHATRACACALPARAHATLACSPRARMRVRMRSPQHCARAYAPGMRPARAHACSPRGRMRPWHAPRERACACACALACALALVHYRAAGERERGAALGDRKEAEARDDVLGEDAAPTDGDRESVASRRGGLSGEAAADDRR